MKVYICNAFSLSMLDREVQGGNPAAVARNGFVRIPRPIDDPVQWLAERDAACLAVDEFMPVVSAIGHPDTARVLSGLLGRNLPANRITVKLEPGVYVLVGQLMDADGGPLRLPEGATTLPEGARIEWWSV